MGISEINIVRYVVYFLYLYGDAILATKTAFVTFFGEFFIISLQMAYKEPRPYWSDPNIQSYRCSNDFEGPSDHIFIIVFFMTYTNLLYLKKYSRFAHNTMSFIMFAIEIALIILIMLAGLILGHAYIFQGIIGIIYGILFVILCLQFDNEIHLLIENAAFLMKKARLYKFYVLFLIIGAFVLVLIYFNLDLERWSTPPILWY
jgi:hypothetical protein